MKRGSPGLVLALAILGISFAGPLVKLSAADPLAIAVWRLGFSLVIVAGFLIATGEWRQWRNVSLRDVLLALIAGVALAFHFWAWNASIHMTTIAASVVLVNLQPAVILVISAIFLREAPTGRQLAGIGIALLGALIIAVPDFVRSHDSTDLSAMGNFLAASAAVTAAIYYSIGRRMRASFGLWAYVGLAYTACFLTLLIMGMATRAPLYPQPSRELWIFAALAIGPMLFGHTGMNWALKFLPAYVVSVVILAEPIGATVLGMILPRIRQVPSLITVAGGVIIMIGVLVTMRSTRASAPHAM